MVYKVFSKNSRKRLLSPIKNCRYVQASVCRSLNQSDVSELGPVYIDKIAEAILG